VDREVDSKGTPKPHPKSLVNKAVNSDGGVKKKRIVMSDDDESSEDDVPLVCVSYNDLTDYQAKRPTMNGTNVCLSLYKGGEANF